jgi:hypothetical protein
MKTLIIPPAETKLGFVVCECNSTGGALEEVARKDAAAEALNLARQLAAMDEHVRVFHEIALTVDPSDVRATAPQSTQPRADARDVLIRRLVNCVNRAGIEVLAERMPSLIEITEALIEAKALGYTPDGAAPAIKYPDTPAGRELRSLHERQRAELRRIQDAERANFR